MLRDTLSRLASDARQGNVLLEYLIIALKEALTALPEVRSMRDVDEQIRLLETAVSISSKESYRT